MDYAFLKWIGEALGPWAPMVLILGYYAYNSKDKKTDIASELIKKIDGLYENMSDVRERVARIEGKMDK